MTTKNTRPSTSHIAPFGLRMQPDLKAQLEKAAEQSGRSMNAEIVARLEKSLHKGNSSDQHTTALVEVIARQNAELAAYALEEHVSRVRTHITSIIIEQLLSFIQNPALIEDGSANELLAMAESLIHKPPPEEVSQYSSENAKRLKEFTNATAELERLLPISDLPESLHHAQKIAETMRANLKAKQKAKKAELKKT